MKKSLIVIGLMMVVVLALGLVGLAYAQGRVQGPGGFFPFGMMGRLWGGGMMGQGWQNGYDHMGSGMMGRTGGYGMMGFYGPMHLDMVEALAGKLGLSAEQLQSRLSAGESMWQVAAAQGLSEEQFRQAMLDAHDLALDKAVAAGLITQEQADRMDEHMEWMWQTGESPR